MMKTDILTSLFSIKGVDQFSTAALEIFRYQAAENPVYKSFISNLGISGNNISSLNDIPFLPVEFFRNHRIISGDSPVEIIFESSGTTGSIPGRHYVTDKTIYEKSFLKCFSLFYGDPGEYLIIALLPSYTEREGSSLVYMADRLIQLSGNPMSGFYRDHTDRLKEIIEDARKKKTTILLLGVSFALLDLAEKNPVDLSEAIVMETGGMKGRRKEITRSELHSILKKNLNLDTVHSEYGMTELLSQAYSSGAGKFRCPPWMKILIRDPQDPLTIYSEPGRTGGINIIDLANVNSCSFISTGDLGRVHEDGSFEVLGRFDNSDVRGCNLMAEQ